jgi:hypothetical protein
MKGVLPWLVRWARHAGTRDFYPGLAALVSPITKYFFPHHTLFQFMCTHRPATWAGSRAGPPVSECVSPGTTITAKLLHWGGGGGGHLFWVRTFQFLITVYFQLDADAYI